MKQGKLKLKQLGQHLTNYVSATLLITMLLLFLMIMSSVITSLQPKYRPVSLIANKVTTNITPELLYSLFTNENIHFRQSLPEEEILANIPRQLMAFVTNLTLDDPRTFLGQELPGLFYFDSEIIVAGDGTDFTNMPYESSPPLEVLLAEKEASLQNLELIDQQDEESLEATDPDQKDVFLYFSHTRESFLPHLKGVTDPNKAHHSEVNVVQVGENLKAELKSRGIGVEIDKTDVITSLTDQGKKYWQAYDESRSIVEAALTNNRDLDYLFDIHRDSQRKKATTIKIGDVDYAKLAFVIGKKHANYEKNIKFANEIHDRLQEKYPGLSRGVIAKGEPGANGKYNQDLSSHAMLIEFGGVDNTFEELNATSRAFADVFSEYYFDAKAVSK